MSAQTHQPSVAHERWALGERGWYSQQLVLIFPTSRQVTQILTALFLTCRMGPVRSTEL